VLYDAFTLGAIIVCACLNTLTIRLLAATPLSIYIQSTQFCGVRSLSNVALEILTTWQQTSTKNGNSTDSQTKSLRQQTTTSTGYASKAASV